MELTKKERTIKYVVYAVILCLLSLLQNVGGLWLEIGGARCFLLVPAAVLLSLDEDEKASALIGLFAVLELLYMLPMKHSPFLKLQIN